MLHKINYIKELFWFFVFNSKIVKKLPFYAVFTVFGAVLLGENIEYIELSIKTIQLQSKPFSCREIDVD